MKDETTRPAGRPPKWPFTTMEIGDVVTFNIGDQAERKRLQRMSHAIARRAGRKVETTTTDTLLAVKRIA